MLDLVESLLAELFQKVGSASKLSKVPLVLPWGSPRAGKAQA